MSGKLSFKKFKQKKRLSNLKSKISNFWAPFVLVTISLILAFLNYQPDTWLTGWDNLHPEFFFKLNIKRSLFAVWQEYQGLGLLGGMAHAADLPRQLILYFFNLIGIPAQNLRYLWTFTMLVAGPLGVYFFIKNLLLKQKDIKLPFDKNTKTFAALLGGLFYLLNLSTVQNFFVPFEAFTSFYGFFPWLLLVTINYLKQPTKRQYLQLILVYILAAPAFYIETLFVVLFLCLLPLFKTTRPKQAITSFLTILVTQAYWLLPVIFFVLTNGHLPQEAKINLISTPETYFRNLEFANIKSISLLKGYLLNFIDLGPGQKFTYLFLPWRQHLENPLINLIGYLNFILILTGIYYAFKKRLKLAPAILSITIISLFFLLGGGLLINQQIPLIGELFRSPFTKFSTPLAFTYSLFFSIGSIFILDLFSFLHTKLTYFFTLFTITLSLIIFISPMFSGQLISSDMKQQIPDEYFEVFDFFKNQDPNTRIANFPQHTFWGWNFYSWGYRGSGFLWYGIKQPILDRAFDVWEPENQNYYQEINAALYSNQKETFENLIEKYAVNWILIDKFVIAAEENQDLKNQDLIDLLDASDNFKLEKNINDNILIYKTNIDKRVDNFLSITPHQDTPTLPKQDPQIFFPSYTETENLVPVEISYKKLPDQLLLKLSPLLPSANSITPETSPNYIYLSLPSFHSSLILEINNQYLELVLPGELLSQPDFYPLNTVYLPTKDPIKISLYTNSPIQTINVTSALKDAIPYQCYTNKKDRDIEKITFANSITLLGTDVVGCLSLPLPSFTPPGLISTQYTYFSSTSTPANSNITTKDLSSSNTPPQALTPQILPFTTRQFSPLRSSQQQLNLILEANNTNSVQEITYQNITTNLHPLLATTTLTLNHIPSHSATLKDTTPKELNFSFPTITSSLNITQTPTQNQLLPQARNCNQFRSGYSQKTIIDRSINYFAQNSTTCDSLDLRHLPHSTNYLIQIDQENIKGLPLTICLENHTTNRCDVFERLQDTPQTQAIIQPISNSEEPPGYTLHLYNQSFGNRITNNNIQSISIKPYPLNFIQNTTIRTDSPSSISNEIRTNIKTTHPTEFLYTVSTTSKKQSSLNLYQSRSPYWITMDGKTKLTPNNLNWHNSWQLPPGEHHLTIFYLPQVLEFFGLLLLITIPITYFFYHKK